MELTHEDVAAILDLLGRTDVEYLEVEIGSTRLIADRSGVTTAARIATATTAVATPAPAAPSPATAPTPPTSSARPVAAAPPTVGPAVVPGEPRTTVTAPMVGVFFRAPEPGAPAFTEVGSHVEAGETLGLVEVMKMFTSVTAPVAGTVVEVLAEDDQFVEYGQPLFGLRPDGVGPA